MEREEDARQIHEAEIVVKAMRLRELKAEAERLSAEIDEHLRGFEHPDEKRRPGGHLHSVE